ncbi:hypothetical protein FOMPIDRAFT_1055613 [Fomitopsis schrenkii]|uniref:Uncharacterized protein n=1 Tax=Fomitopsis schrenkii TaxID=2126942 RepID=S8EW30_FOMSC|nr:hypothetical protein FOMPIDRAFT_1055613 [Fomitopsis schrenkii]
MLPFSASYPRNRQQAASMGSGPSKPEEKLRELEERVRDQERFMMMMILRGVVENIGHDGRRNTRDDTERREAAAAREEVLIRELKESVKAAEEAKRRCEEIRKEAEEKVATAQTGERNARAALEEAEQELRAANEAREEAERNLRNGIRPIIIPTQEQWEATKRNLPAPPARLLLPLLLKHPPPHLLTPPLLPQRPLSPAHLPTPVPLHRSRTAPAPTSRPDSPLAIAHILLQRRPLPAPPPSQRLTHGLFIPAAPKENGARRQISGTRTPS